MGDLAIKASHPIWKQEKQECQNTLLPTPVHCLESEGLSEAVKEISRRSGGGKNDATQKHYMDSVLSLSRHFDLNIY